MRVKEKLASLALLLMLCSCAAQADYFGIDLTQPLRLESQGMEHDSEMQALLARVEERNCIGAERARAPDCAPLIAQIVERATPRSRDAEEFARLPLVVVAREAEAGSNRAQFELGTRFEEGRGVAQNLAYARALYEQATVANRPETPVWVPDGNGSGGSIVYVSDGSAQEGIPEARERLEALQNTQDGSS